MTKIMLKDKDGGVHVVDAADGVSVMEAVRPLDRGVTGECEGSLACATCHVWVGAAWLDRLAPVSDGEADMLDCAFHTRAASRLCCQILVSQDLDGLEIEIPHA
jgi:2Fe-2S ferredoxin